jgi:Immunity protein 10
VPIEFVARVAGVDDEYCLVAAVAERDDGTGRTLMFQAADEPPDEQEVSLGLDTYCVVTETEATAYGCVKQLSIIGDQLHLVVSDEAREDLGLADTEVRVHLAVPPESIDTLRNHLKRILTYGRPEAHPAPLHL